MLSAALPLTVALAGCGAAADRAAQVLTSISASPTRTAAAGRLVAGFPTSIPVPDGVHVTASAVQGQGALLAASVTGTSSLSVTSLLAFYRARLTDAGFTSTGDSLPAGASGTAYERAGGTEMLVVAVVDRGAERSFSVGGTVSA
jgi:hypothetical protein